jgi:hypothetical protein
MVCALAFLISKSAPNDRQRRQRRFQVGGILLSLKQKLDQRRILFLDDVTPVIANPARLQKSNEALSEACTMKNARHARHLRKSKSELEMDD